MNIAFPAFLIFLLILPGFLFSYAFFKTEDIPLTFVPITKKAVVSFFISFLLHITWCLVAVYLFRYQINLELILLLLTGGVGDKYVAAISTVSSWQIILVAIYLISMYFGAYLSGKGIRWIIRKNKWDKSNHLFRIDSPWYYLFTLHDCNNDTADGVRIAAVTEIAGVGYIYAGWLDRFYLDSSGNLERIVLVRARRRQIADDKTKGEASFEVRFYPIDGDFFILKYSEIKSLNVQYLKIDDASLTK